ncbi:MAG: hypothetical protein ABI405_02225 [Parafilimonas sp.]
MEVHHHPKVEKKNFKEYFLEFLMIFLAVTMGFIAENIREHITDNQRETEYVQSLYNDMEQDSANIQLVELRNNLQIKVFDSLILLIQQPSLDSNEINRLYFFARFATRTTNFEPTNRTISQLNNSGNFRLIRNVSLADSILDYERRLSIFEENHIVSGEEQKLLYPFIATIFEANVFQTMVDSLTNFIYPPAGLHTIDASDKKLIRQFIYYLHQVKSTRVAEKINLQRITQETSTIRNIIKANYKIE